MSPMCPVRCVTYVSGSAFQLSQSFTLQFLQHRLAGFSVHWSRAENQPGENQLLLREKLEPSAHFRLL